tara:strand:+ start:1991 stop:2347 length:357 start_codon:yes stop_codon:yes gene_type:complete
MARSSVGSEVTFNGTTATELRAVQISNDSVSALDITDLANSYAQQVLNKHENAMFTVVTLDDPGWYVSDGPAALTIKFANDSSPTDYGNSFCISKSIDLGIDSAIEFTFTFEQEKAGN